MPTGGGTTTVPPPEDKDAPMTTARPRHGYVYLLKRIAFYLVSFVVAVTANFMIPRFMPGDPALDLARKLQAQGITVTPEMLAGFRDMFGNSREDLIGQYVKYWERVVHLDFGLSTSHFPVPVIDVVMQSLPWTLYLAGITTIVSWLIGTALGAWAGWRPGGRLDVILTPITTFLNAVPAFWLSLLLVWIFAFSLEWFPSRGGYNPDVPYRIDNVWFQLSVAQHAILPALSLILIGYCGWMFSMRNVMISTVSEDYVQLARAKGMSPRHVLIRYAARNALLPNVTGLATAIGGILGGVVLTEVVFTYPGMGMLIVDAIRVKDYPVMQTIFLFIVVAVLICNFIADSLYVVLDPRTRDEA